MSILLNEAYDWKWACDRPFYHVLSLAWCVLLSLKYLFNFRDESASATFYFREHTEPGTKGHPSCDIAKPVSDNLEEVWMYYRPLKPGEHEFPLRNKQVRKISILIRYLKHILPMLISPSLIFVAVNDWICCCLFSKYLIDFCVVLHWKPINSSY